MKKSCLFGSLISWTAVLGLVLSTSAHGAFLPIVTIWETPNANGGTYTVSVDSTQSPYNWFLNAFAVTTDFDTTGVNTFRPGWGADLVTSTQWDDGINYDLEGPFGEMFPVFSTGATGVGSFANVFGPGNKAAVFWTSQYFASAIGPNNTTSSFEWLDGAPASTAFALISGGPNGNEYLACPVGLNQAGNECMALDVNAIPLPAAAWLFGSGLLGLIVLARGRKV